MPLARIDVPRGRTSAFRRIVGDVVYESMLDTLKVPATIDSRSSASMTHRTWCWIPGISVPAFLLVHRHPGDPQ